MVDIIYLSLRVDKLDKILYNLNNILASKRANRWVDRQLKLLVDTETTYITKIITLVREEELLDNIASGSLIWWLRGAQLPIDVDNGLLLGVTWVLMKRIVDNREVDARGVLIM